MSVPPSGPPAGPPAGWPPSGRPSDRRVAVAPSLDGHPGAPSGVPAGWPGRRPVARTMPDWTPGRFHWGDAVVVLVYVALMVLGLGLWLAVSLGLVPGDLEAFDLVRDGFTGTLLPEVGLDVGGLLPAISYRKGCYVGQEIMARLEARGNAEVLLGSQATIPAGKALVVSGQRCLAGWDGTGSAVLTVAGTLEFRAGIMLTVGNTAWVQRFVKPGTRVETPGFAATIADYEERSDKTTNRMWLSDLTGLPQPGESFVFGMSSDVGDGIDVEIPLSATVTAVASRGMPMLQRFRSGAIGDGTAEPTVEDQPR